MNSMFLLFLTVLATFIGIVSSGSGKCPTKSKAAVVVWPPYVGTWYEYQSYGDGTTRTFYKCMKYTFTSTEDSVNAVRDYIFKGLNIKGSSHYTIEEDGFTDFIMKGSGVTTNVGMTQIGTDNDNFSILWSCEEKLFGAYHTESSWILTRNRTESLNKDIEAKINKVLKDNSMDRSWYGAVTQSGC